jgi:O-antigen/teichoic acid export membrane protein
MVGDAFAKVAGFVFVVLIARGLGTEEYGYLNFALSFVPLFLIVATWGLNDAMFRDVAHDRARLSPLFASGIRLRVGMGLVALGLAVGAAPLLVTTDTAFWTVVLIGLALLFDEISGFVSTVFKAFEAMRFRAIRIGLNRIATLVLAAAAVAAGGSLLAVSGAYLLGSVAALVFSLVALRRYFPPINLGDWRRAEAVGLLKRGAPLALASVASMAVFRIDAVLIQAIDGPRDVGMYGVAYRFLDSLLFVAWAFASLVVPRMGPDRSGAELTRVFSATWMLALFFYLPLAVGAPFAAEWVVGTVFGTRYLPAAAAVPWLLWAGVAYASAYLARMGLLALGKRKQIAWIALTALVINLAANAIAIPKFGFVGAAAVTLLSGAIEAILLAGVMLKATGSSSGLSLLGAPFVASAAMGVALFVTGARDLAAVLIGGLVYLGSVGLVLALVKIERIREALARPPRNV